jgi:hypothetical protein
MRKYYVGLDVHKVSIAIAVLDAHGNFENPGNSGLVDPAPALKLIY